ncbi:autotransporter outer membrane beta-barrel domain-containing protein [Planktotalea sp.]|uniref:autotransporter outer membrane beta-barrel domain-containing protein n=1 Tax=Planktotalea sp. TaxID=2029877 RepID=UPI003D6A122A
MKITSIVTAAKRSGVLLACFVASPALSFTLDCTGGTGTHNGGSSAGGTVILAPGGSVTLMQADAPTFTMRIDGRTFDAAGNQMGTALACQNSPGGMFEVPYTKGQSDCETWTFSPGDGGEFQVEPSHNETSFVKWTLTCGEGGGATAAAVKAGPTAQQIATAQNNVTQSSQISAGGQSNAASGAVSGAIGSRLGGSSGVSVSTQGFFVSTAGALGRPDADWNGWVALGHRRFDGPTLSAKSTALTFGVDRRFSDRFLLGLMVTGDDLTLKQGALSSDMRSFAGGPYFAANLGPVTLDGYIARGKTEVKGGLGNFDSDRMLGALNARYSYQLHGWTATPFASVRGYRDEEPGRTVGIVPIAAREVTSITASVGGTFAYEMKMRGQSVTPFITLAAEQTNFDNGLGTRSSNRAPRVALGINSDGRYGSLALSIDRGELSNGLRDYGVSISYALRF